MKNIRFYLEYDSPKDKKENHNNGNVVAIFTSSKEHLSTLDWWESLRSLCLENPNQEVQKIPVNNHYLHYYCKRINEDIARIIHPKLFEVL